uniref:Uncharacterized protein n=1 Tax=Chromera velia CCMP2878 TaxID=1169474 RepID=A0A0G4G6H2_9ALVE|eukprot:Cvel_4227.t2-p1 / transcript=Cvel_4227.t2 / gene=Cvel_4227 / organism=Chromera_velia_CCMP2878 / gene_product=hypothetical protein / transcript_product=hypothetical protein / location=Cvel_scaffold183:6519-13629(-) / protein_length=77 / sequence_SO=supercontig / SO=protein_coding / is_pseudo=false
MHAFQDACKLDVWIGRVGEKAYMSGESYKPLEAPLPEGEIVEYITTCLIMLHDVPYTTFPIRALLYKDPLLNDGGKF